MDHLPTPVCPLVTPFTRKLCIPDETMERILRIRQWDTENGPPIPFQWPSALRKTIWNPADGCDTGEPLLIRQYQLQQIHNLVRLPRMLDGDSVGLGKTLCAIAAACWLKERNPRIKVIVLCTKSTFFQWTEEFRRFSTLRVANLEEKYKKKTSYEARFEQFRDFLGNEDAEVLVCRYTSLMGRRKKVEGKFDASGRPTRGGQESISAEVRELAAIVKPFGPRVLLVTDECQKFKLAGSAMNILVQMLQKHCAYRWGLTATAIKNNLEEFYSILVALGIKPFGTLAEFMDEFCLYRDVHVGRGVYKRTLQGYRNVARFKEGVRPFFYGRSQAQVKEKLPKLITLMHPLELDSEQKRLLLRDIPSGAYRLPPHVFKLHGVDVFRERDPDNIMTKMAVYRAVANSVALLDPTNEKAFHSPALSPKEECLLDLLDGDLLGDKVIVYTSFRSHINRLQWLTENGKFSSRKFLRITGAENVREREVAKQKFQDPNSGYDVIYINQAAIEGCNLQAARHIFTLDVPFSYGDFFQLIGRAVRVKSLNETCTLHIAIARGTIDEFALSTLRGKKTLFESILGDSHSAGIFDDTAFDISSGMEKLGTDAEFRGLMRAHAKEIGMNVFLSGELIVESEGVAENGLNVDPMPKTRRKASSAQQYDDYIPEDVEALWG